MLFEKLAQKYLNNVCLSNNVIDKPLLRFDLQYCKSVADYYEQNCDDFDNLQVVEMYSQFKQETYNQFTFLLNEGVDFRPWLKEGQPYKNFAELKAQVLKTGTIYIYLTKNGYGNEDIPEFHPMTAPSPSIIDGETLLYNDLFRGIHDFWGHLMYGSNFQVKGELLAAYNHMRMYSKTAAMAMFCETVGQICWYFYGPHLRKSADSFYENTDPEYIPPGKRPYSEQKTIIFPDKFLEKFEASFSPLN